MDPLFERFERLVRSYLRFGAPSDEWFEQHQENTDYQEAMEELDEFLRTGTTGSTTESTSGSSSSRSSGRYSRQRSGQNGFTDSRHSTYRGASGTTHRMPPEELRNDYALFGVAFGAPFPEVRNAYRKLMRTHHPDVHAGDQAKQHEATQKSQELNTAYQRIKAWEAAKRGA